MFPSDVLDIVHTVIPPQDWPIEAAAPDDSGRYVFLASINEAGHSFLSVRRETKSPFGRDSVDICLAEFSEEGELVRAFTPSADSTGVEGLCEWLAESLSAFDWDVLVDGE